MSIPAPNHPAPSTSSAIKPSVERRMSSSRRPAGRSTAVTTATHSAGGGGDSRPLDASAGAAAVREAEPNRSWSTALQRRTSLSSQAAAAVEEGDLPALLIKLDTQLSRTNRWSSWTERDDRLAAWPSLVEVFCGWRARQDRRSYEAVAALTSIGARRGGDDDEAALAVVALLSPGIAKLADRLHDLCELEDVQAAVWEEVKLAEPHADRLAARFLLRRARQRLTRPAAGWVSRIPTTSLEDVLGRVVEAERTDLVGRVLGVEDPEDPAADLDDLLTWAAGTGVVDPADVGLVVEMLAAARLGLGVHDAAQVVGERRGVCSRTVRRRRDATVARLRDAAPAYLAATA